jgi:hypothetical protein
MLPPEAGIPQFATNRPESNETVASAINRLLKNTSDAYGGNPAPLSFATAYMNPAGFVMIADEVEKAPRVRLLLGADPEEPFRRQLEQGQAISFDDVAKVHLSELERDRDLLGFTAHADAAAHRLVKWLRSIDADQTPRVEVRRFTKGFLHGKAYIVENPHMPAALAGSSNLTRAGMSWNRELNLGWGASHETSLVLDWFNELWDQSSPFDLASLFEARWHEHAPGIVFLRMLHELYGDTLESQTVQTDLEVTDFQRDGIRRARRILSELGGVLVCDEVGLGKTYIAGEIIKQVSEQDRQNVLVIVPAALKSSTWEPFLKRYGYSRRVQIATYDDVRIGTKSGVRPEDLDDYSLVVIDEAHNLRNPATLTAEAVKNLLTGAHPKRLVLLTATPVNNSLKDLQTLVSYFVPNDAEFASIGIPSISEYIKAAQAMDVETLSAEHLFDLMDKVAVRRTRRFVKDAYAGDRLRNNRGELVPVEFPQPKVERVTYELDFAASSIVEEMIHALEYDDDASPARAGDHRDPSLLSLARYASSRYRLDAAIELFQVRNAGLLRSMLLKRLESSTAALEVTLGRLITSHQTFLRAMADGLILSGDALKEYASTDAETVEEFIEGLDEDAREQADPISEFQVDLLKKDVEGDLELLERFHAMAVERLNAGPDDKVLSLVEDLARIADEAERPHKDGISTIDRRKVIIFSTYAETVRSVHSQIEELIKKAPNGSVLAAFKGRVAPAVFGAQGSDTQANRATVLANFAPTTAGELNADGTPKFDDEFDILVTTDVLSEGVNLQQAGRMINFDLPWNPMKLVQRHGRIDRIGSPHKHVYIDCFFPAQNLDALLGLEAILQRKIALANAAIGVGHVIPDQISNPNVEVLYRDPQADIEDLYNEDAAIFVQGGGTEALSGEEYRHRLEKGLEMATIKRDMLALPYGAGSGFISKSVHHAGYVFCVRIGDEDKPWFRFVATDRETWTPTENSDGTHVVFGDTLTCLMAADPGTYTGDQVMQDEALRRVFDAWAVAQDDVYEKWTFLTDKANLEPKIAKPLRQAIELVAEKGQSLGVGPQDVLMAKLSGRWSTAVVKSVRSIVRNEGLSEKQKVKELDRFVLEAGLAIPEKPKPLKPVRKDDIRVICWMAVQPETARPLTIAEQVGEFPLGDTL